MGRARCRRLGVRVRRGQRLYWALGGEAGTGTIAAGLARVPLANAPLVVWATAGLKALARILVLALARP